MLRSMLLALALVASVSACGKKKSPAAPANAAPESGGAPGGSDGDVKDESKPDDPDDAQKMGADPCDGGE
jgi:predicted small lipoprotein YifL